MGKPAPATAPPPAVDLDTAKLDEIMRALPEDLDIWNHQIYLDPPGLATSEGAGSSMPSISTR